VGSRTSGFEHNTPLFNSDSQQLLKGSYAAKIVSSGRGWTVGGGREREPRLVPPLGLSAKAQWICMEQDGWAATRWGVGGRSSQTQRSSSDRGWSSSSDEVLSMFSKTTFCLASVRTSRIKVRSLRGAYELSLRPAAPTELAPLLLSATGHRRTSPMSEDEDKLVHAAKKNSPSVG